MNRDEQEMAMWREAYFSSRIVDRASREADADAAVEAFRKWFPPQPQAAPAAVWYDTPPHPGEYYVEGLPRVCWVDEDVVWYPAWDSAGERPRTRELSRNGRRVSPVTKPQEPTPPEPTTPEPVPTEVIWYDEPPFAKDEANYPCWIEDYPYPILVAHLRDGWAYQVPICVNRWNPLAGRRVSPIAKPPEPTP